MFFCFFFAAFQQKEELQDQCCREDLQQFQTWARCELFACPENHEEMVERQNPVKQLGRLKHPFNISKPLYNKLKNNVTSYNIRL